MTNKLITKGILGIDFLSKHACSTTGPLHRPCSIHIGGVEVMSNKPGKGDASNATTGHMYVASTAGGENDDAEEIAVPNVERR